MPLYDHTGPIADTWVRADQGAFAQWHGQKVLLSYDDLSRLTDVDFGSAKSIGIELGADDAIDLLAPYVDRLGLVSIRFDTFKDGRGFTLARLIRERFQFAGELRASGDILLDQVPFLIRVGFSSFELPADIPEEQVTDALHRYTVWFQRAADSRTPAQVLRGVPHQEAAE